MRQMKASHRENTSPRDPAPSRLSYRYQRLLLTPLFRTFLRVGLPMGAAFALGMAVLGNADNRDAIALRITEIRNSIEERPEFMVKLMAIDGASPEVNGDIREIVPIDFPLSSFDLDLEEMRLTIAELDAVASAEVRIRAGGVLQIDVIERIPSVVWRGPQGVELLDSTGHRVGALIARAERPDLPLLTGEGAELAVPEALDLFAAAEPLASRVRGLVRMGERRWDVALDRNQRILLPEENPVEAIERVIALDHVQDLMARDLVVIDMRNQNRPTVRLAETAVTELRRIRGQVLGDTTQ
ncbi:cell division protein FtsQ/DivIB [Pseudohalocynthiibacter aestuariivivens]|jgi:cell division protein FtsQ|uniref:Cell division protein FtsQ n=1 Tax=Pseudohalocynthiibacter aestuariivivens TaxID=1591409 RepID=A0ABV5JA21_9RHOB|nr:MULTISPECIES: cell division protein FtsQ/DivIB [Pseudohalocynthiibacter]MBS9716873.1 cell division protein FtsQ/DivIB [Pseudohalocynthiibacter aestuariivivens]MCK0102034.1 cell division protein FtsQ/DivIB [Pseudohalocynthiibacter sp. F2068]